MRFKRRRDNPERIQGAWWIVFGLMGLFWIGVYCVVEALFG